jgi:hypothetical protein
MIKRCRRITLGELLVKLRLASFLKYRQIPTSSGLVSLPRKCGTSDCHFSYHNIAYYQQAAQHSPASRDLRRAPDPRARTGVMMVGVAALKRVCSAPECFPYNEPCPRPPTSGYPQGATQVHTVRRLRRMHFKQVIIPL